MTGLCQYIPIPGSSQWFRLARTSNGILCLEAFTATGVIRPAPSAEWAFQADVPPHIAIQLIDDDDPGEVLKVLNRALRALRYI